MFPFKKTFTSVIQAKLVGLMFICALLALLIVGLLVTFVTWLTADFVELSNSWLDVLLTSSVGILTGIGGWFMLPALTVLIAGFFQETTIQRVERLYYPDAARRGDLKFWPELWHDIRFTLWAVLLNLLVLPLYLFGIGLAVSILLNAYLLGREFFEGAAAYHIGKAEAKALRRKYRKTTFSGGMVITVMTLVPILNMCVPLLAIVWMLHVYHAIRRNGLKH